MMGGKGTRFKKNIVVDTDMNSIRMTLVERTLFIIGIISFGGNLSFPAIFESPIFYSLYWGFANAAPVLVINPIAMFLCRVSSSWSPWASLAIGLCVNSCAILSASAALVGSTEASWGASACILAATLVLVCNAMYAMWGTHLVNAERRRLEAGGGKDSQFPSLETKSILDDGFRTFVIAVHIFVVFVLLAINCVWYPLNGSLAAIHLEIFFYICVAAATLVFILEQRVRKVRR
jgi:hypothetical protein